MKAFASRVLASAILTTTTIGGHADDIDLYVGGKAVSGVPPNVLIVLDNSTNWSAQSQHWTDGATQGQSELQTLDEVIATLNDEVNIGLMTFAQSGESMGGQVRYSMRTMTEDNKATLRGVVQFMKIDTASGSSPDEVSSSTNYDDLMNSAYRYYLGMDRWKDSNAGQDRRDYDGNPTFRSLVPNPAGTTYYSLTGANTNPYKAPPHAGEGCGKNFIIFIGNGFPSAVSANGNDLVTVGDWIHKTPNTAQIVPISPKNPYMDEWTRFMYQYGVPGVDDPTSQTQPRAKIFNKIATYTIDVCKDRCEDSQATLLKSAANVGGGKYFRSTSQSEIKSALQQIFQEIQAVNSVFSSATLPVSVNTQGTYENQVYIGMFRPDSGARPRWNGNLKLFQFAQDPVNNSLFLADKYQLSAINPQTGFVTDSSTSFWTCGPQTKPAAFTETVANPWPPAGETICGSPGFWSFAPDGTGGQYDGPDGPIVEKGAAAYRQRSVMAGDISATAGVANSATRTVYTAASGALVPFVDNAAYVPTASIPDPQNAQVSLNRVAGSLTVSASGTGLTYSNGQAITLTANTGATAGYDGTYVISGASGTGFSFTIPLEKPATPATVRTSVANITATKVGVPETATLSINYAANTATATVTQTYDTVSTVTVTDNAAVDNPFVLFTGTLSDGAAGAGDTSIAYTLPAYTCTSTKLSNPGKSLCGTTKIGTKSADVAKLQRVGNKLLVTLTAALPSGYVKTAAGSFTSSDQEPWINGKTFTVAGITSTDCGSIPANTFCVSLPLNNEPAVSAAISGAVGASVPITITRAGTVATATTVGAVPHNLVVGNSVSISGANEGEYNGAKSVLSNTATTFTFSVPVSPATPSGTYTASAGGAETRANLIRWVRGQDIADDENGSGTKTDVRASLHADVLHSRPLVVNFGGTVGVVAFYGTNDGLYHAVKGGRGLGTNVDPGTSSDGREKWAFIPPEFMDRSKLSRLYNDSPLIEFPTLDQSAIVPTPTKRDYFWDGVTGVYQGPITGFVGNQTWIFPTMRRGGRSIYALNVTNPDLPELKWSITGGAGGDFDKLGFTWSEPKVVKLCGPDSTRLALVFGGGYNPAEDDKAPTPVYKAAGTYAYAIASTTWASGVLTVNTSSANGLYTGQSVTISGAGGPLVSGTVNKVSSNTFTMSAASAPVGPTTATYTVGANSLITSYSGYPVRASAAMGSGVYVVDLISGQRIAFFDPAISSPATKKYSVPADVTPFPAGAGSCVKHIYAGDSGANLWRIDFDQTVDVSIASAVQNGAKIRHLAQLGEYSDGTAGGTDDRRLLYPPELLPVALPSGGAFVVLAGTGDREQPLYKAYRDNFYMVIDPIAVSTVQGGESSQGYPATAGDLKAINRAVTPIVGFDINTEFSAPTVSSPAPTYLGYALPFVYGVDTSGNTINIISGGEKQVNSVKVVSGAAYFATNQPQAPDPTIGVCSNLGLAGGYAVSPLSGKPFFDRDEDGVAENSDYAATFATGGLAPTSTSGIVRIVNADGSVDYRSFVIGTGGSGDGVHAGRSFNLPTHPPGGPSCTAPQIWDGANCVTPTKCADGSSSIGGCDNDIVLPGERSRVYWYNESDQ